TSTARSDAMSIASRVVGSEGSGPMKATIRALLDRKRLAALEQRLEGRQHQRPALHGSFVGCGSPSNCSCTTPNLVTSAPTLDSSYVTRDGRSCAAPASRWARHDNVKRLFDWMSRISPSTTLKFPSPMNAYREPFLKSVWMRVP